MKKINAKKWRAFTIGGNDGLFNVVKGKRLTKADMCDGQINYIGASATNNGITATVSNDEHLHPANTITVSYNGSVGEAFYQSEPFWASDDVNVLYPRFPMTRLIAMFMIPLIRLEGKKFAFVDKWTKNQMEVASLVLPVTAKKEPDYAYMEEFMASLEKRVKKFIDCVELGNGQVKNKINISSWRPFHLYDDNLFEINSGTKLDHVKMTNNNPSVNFVGRANANNGVTDFIDAIPGLKPYDAGLMTISLGGEYLGSCFVQDKPFYTSQNVNVLIPKRPMTDACKRFIGTVIFREGQLHYKAFSDELNRHMKRDFSILLPSCEDGTPDFDFMDAFMKKREMTVTKSMAAYAAIA